MDTPADRHSLHTLLDGTVRTVSRTVDNAKQKVAALGDSLRLALTNSRSGAFRVSGKAPRNRPLLLHRGRFAAVIPGDSIAEQVITTGIGNFLSLYNVAVVGRLILTWFPNPPAVIVGPLSTLCDPYLNLFRGIIPPLGGTLDLSPILAFIVLDVFTNTAAALPSENGSNSSARGKRFPTLVSPSAAMLAWHHHLRRQSLRRRQARQRALAAAEGVLSTGLTLNGLDLPKP